MVIVCHEKGFNENVTGNIVTGMTLELEGRFFGWSKNNMTTKTYIESLTNQKKSQLLYNIYLSEHFGGMGKPINSEKLRITFPDGQCYAVTIPKQMESSTKQLENIVLRLRLKKTQHPKIYLHDPNTFNGYFNLAEVLLFDQSLYHVFDVTLAETRKNPEDPQTSCVDYGKNTFLDCSSRRAEEAFIPLLGCVPPWFTAQLEFGTRKQLNDKDRLSQFFFL